ncbi:hypothetical protein QR685DRAFT_593942 [Neurospora intermedia]|uniref:Uncharacterized protein n=1 Tax=Neurospora intermedia TaxID=5142 RepID=A0ABR3DRQ0_NEUIN
MKTGEVGRSHFPAHLEHTKQTLRMTIRTNSCLLGSCASLQGHVPSRRFLHHVRLGLLAPLTENQEWKPGLNYDKQHCRMCYSSWRT